MKAARDKFWMFGVRAHQDDRYLGYCHRGHFSAGAARLVPGEAVPESRITPAEAALMLDIPNMLMINCEGVPAPFSHDARGYAESFITMDKVLWSVVGSGAYRAGNEDAFVCALAEQYPNVVGAFMDDLFVISRSPDEAEALLKEIRAGLSKACRPLELYTVMYTHEVDPADPKLMEYIDGISLWTWESKDLVHLEENFENFEKKFPKHKKLLGIYMFDFTTGKAVPNELMEHQCELGLRWLKEGRIDGMIFEANSLMGFGLPSELWLRDWIKKVKYTEIPD